MRVSAFVITFTATVASSGTLPGAELLTLRTASSIALENNRQLQAARFEIAAAEARLIDAGKLPNPELELAARRSQAGGDDREGSVFAGFRQRFPVTDRLRRSREVRRKEIDLAKTEVRDRERLLLAEVQSQFVRTLAARERVQVLADLKRRTEAYVTLAKQRLARAQGSELDVASARTEVLLAIQAKQQAEAGVREALVALRPLLGMKTDAEVQLAGSVESVIAELRGDLPLRVPDALERTDVMAARVSRERAETQQRLAEARRWEDWEIAVGYENERSVDEPVGAERDHFFSVGVRIPLPILNKGRGRIAEARAEAARAEKELEAVRAASLAEVAREIEAVRKAEALADSLANETLPLIEEREEKTRQAYAQGVIDFTPVLQLQHQQARLRDALLESRRDHALALVRLQKALGSHPRLKTHQQSKQK